MKETLKIMPLVLYFFIGIISFMMALKSVFSKKYLPFHEAAAGKPWNEIDQPLQFVILSILRLGGLGFLVMSILLIGCSLAGIFTPNIFSAFIIPVIALIYCTGLFANNYYLYKKTRADAPWKGSLYAMFAVIAGIVITIVN
jgi:sensor histidine kinase YesM